MLKLELYETSLCHLCEQVQEMLLPYVEHGLCVVELIDIAEHDRLLSEFGVRIPVLAMADTGAELAWPFDREQLDTWLRQHATESAD